MLADRILEHLIHRSCFDNATIGNHRHLIEFGTRDHLIRPRGQNLLKIGLGYAQLVEHAGAQAKPFVTPSTGTAQEAGQQAADAVLGKYIERANALSSVEAA